MDLTQNEIAVLTNALYAAYEAMDETDEDIAVLEALLPRINNASRIVVR